MKKLVLCSGLLVILTFCNSFVFATTAIGVATPSEVVIGADARVTYKQRVMSVCKIGLNSRMAWAYAGLAWAPQYNFRIGDFTALLGAEDGNSLLSRIVNFEEKLLPQLNRVLMDVRRSNPQEFETNLEGKFFSVQFFFNETKLRNEVSRFWLWDSHYENPMVGVEKRLPYLPQDQRSRTDPYLDIPPRLAVG